MRRYELPAVPWRVRDGLWVFLWAWIGLPLVLALSIRYLAIYLPFLAGFAAQIKHADTAALLTFNAINAVAAFGLVTWYLRMYHVQWTDVGLRGFDLIKALFYIAGVYLIFIVGIALLYGLVTLIYPHFDPNQAQTNEFTSFTSPAARNLSFIALVLIPPFIEETVFRGFIFPVFAQRWGLWIGAVASSLLFGIAHMQLNITLYTFVLGLLLCMMYNRLKSIWPGIIFHMLNNYLAFAVLMKK